MNYKNNIHISSELHVTLFYFNTSLKYKSLTMIKQYNNMHYILKNYVMKEKGKF